MKRMLGILDFMEKCGLINFGYIRLFHSYDDGELGYSGMICDYDHNEIIDFDSEESLEEQLIELVKNKTP